jgi:hypothetical protein
MRIDSSLDWWKIEIELTNQVDSIGYNPDLAKMLKNIDVMVDDLSKSEVEARRTHVQHYAKVKLDKVNNAIDHLEKLLLIAKLMY